MKRKLKRNKKPYWNKGKCVSGNLSGVSGDLSGVSGVLTGVRGDLTGVSGDLTGVSGNLSGVSGDLTDCDITPEDREKGVHINDLIQKEKSDL